MVAVWVRCARHGLLARGAEGVVRRLGRLEEDLVRVRVSGLECVRVKVSGIECQGCQWLI